MMSSIVVATESFSFFIKIKKSRNLVSFLDSIIFQHLPISALRLVRMIDAPTDCMIYTALERMQEACSFNGSLWRDYSIYPYYSTPTLTYSLRNGREGVEGQQQRSTLQ